MHSVMWTGSLSPHFGPCREQHFLFKGLPWLKGLDTEKLTWLPGSEVFSQQRPPPPQHTGCHHLSMAWRHSLSQQMRGLSERAPQFLRDSGEGGSRHARLWFLPTVLLFVQAGLDHSAWSATRSADWTWGERMTSALEGVFRSVSSFVQQVCFWSWICCMMVLQLIETISILSAIQTHQQEFALVQSMYLHKTKCLKAYLV